MTNTTLIRKESVRNIRHIYRRKRALFDLDSIIADLLTPWLEWYNQCWGDNLKLQQVVTYNIETHVKPECGNRIYDFFQDPSRYGAIPIFEGAIKGLKTLADNNVDIVIVTATAGQTAPQKHILAKKAAPWLTRKDIIIGSRKEILHGDFFIDDAPTNLTSYRAEWPDTHLVTIGYPYNQEFRHKVSLFAEDCYNPTKAWDEIVDFILSTNLT